MENERELCFLDLRRNFHEKRYSLIFSSMLVISSIISSPAIVEEQAVESLDNPIDGSIEWEYRNVFLQNGITDKSIQDRLIGKIENGELIDADNPESEPIRSEETEQ